MANVDDLDDAAERLLEPRAQCETLIRARSGHLVPMQGGGLLAYFGYPHSLEDGAVRAVRAAMLVCGMARDGIAIRCSVHTGLILTGGDPSLPDTLGKTSATTIQLRQGVAHGQTAISSHTHALVTGYFDCTPLGARALTDTGHAMELFRVDRERGARTRLDAALQLTPLTGRQAELAQLWGLWEDVKQGRRQAVLIQGEPGIGKSRLLHAFKLQLESEPHVVREMRCFPEYQHSPFHPVMALLEADPGRFAGDVGELGSPTLHKERTIERLCDMLQGSRQEHPLLLIVEDLHWADPSTLELLAALVGRPGAAAVLALFTARAGFAAPFSCAVRPLAPLRSHDMAQLIASVGSQLPEATIRHIVERADGVPLFAEELAKTALRDDWASIPGTLQDVLAARLDSLGSARQIAQLAATIGREFDVELLRLVCEGGAAPLQESLDELKDAALIQEVDATTCQFRHALIQEAAYQSHSRADQRAAHRQIAHALQRHFAARVAARPELLARHLSLGGEVRQSIDHWIAAGQRSLQGSANLEAIAHFDHALQLLATLPASRDRDLAEFAILAGLGPALHATQGYGSVQATEVSARLSALREAAGDSADVFQAEWTRLRNTVATIGPRGVPPAAMRLASLAHAHPTQQQASYYVAAVASFWLGEFEASRAHAARAVELYRADQHQEMLASFGENLSISFAGHLSWALCFLGFPSQAQAVCERMLREARAMAHPKTLAMALLFASMLHRWLHQHAQTLALAAEAMALTRQHDMAHWMETSEALHGWAEVMLSADAHRDVRAHLSLATRLSTASPTYAALRWVGMAEIHMRLHQHHEAIGLLAKAQASESVTGSFPFAAERHRLSGECLLALSPPDVQAAEAHFDEALAISRAQAAKLLELRAALSMARLWHSQGKKDEARRLLAATCEAFPERSNTPDLAEAADQRSAWTPHPCGPRRSNR